MFVENLTPILVIGGACALGDAGLIVPVIQNAMLIAGLVTLVQLLRQSVTSPVSQRAVSDVRNVKNKVTGEPAYPWREHFGRYMPWEKVGFDAWYASLDLDAKQAYGLEGIV